MNTKLLIVGLLVTLVGCIPTPRLQDAATNYIYDVCPSAFGIENSNLYMIPKSAPRRGFSFYCPEEDGVVTYVMPYEQIPAKYWEKTNEQ